MTREGPRRRRTGPRGRGRRVGLARLVGLVGLVASVFWGARGATSTLPPWGVVERAVRAPMVHALGRRGAARLLGRGAVRRALRQAFAGFRAGRDRVDVHLDEGTSGAEPHAVELVVRVYVGGAGRCLRLEPGSPERGASECVAQAPPPPRTVRLSDDLWRRPPRRRPPRTERRGRTRSPPKSTEAPASAARGGPPPSVLRRPPPGTERPQRALRQGQRLLGRLATLRLAARSARWKDPFAPRLAVGDAAPDVKLLRRRPPTSWPQWTSIEGNALENLRYHFGQGRMRPAWPVPDFFGERVRRPPGALGGASVARPSGDCLAAWAARERHPDPPKLACFRRALRARTLSRDTVYQAASLLGRFLAFPLFGQIVAARVGETKRETVSSALWLHTWMGWARLHPARLGAAARALTAEERVRLREHLWRWWGRRAYAPYERTMSRLYERHFGALYPASLGPDGLPRRGRLPDTALWALNWLHAVERFVPLRRLAAVEALRARPEELRVLRALSSEPGVSREVPRTAAALAVDPAVPAPPP